MKNKIKELSIVNYDKIVKLRHQIHENPELGFEEYKTKDLITSTLNGLGIEVKHIAKTGIVGLIRGNSPGKTVLLRADMDALAINEEADVPYKSKISNRMHACGHDGHTAGLLGAAMILNEMKDMFSGNVKLVFQPAEESEGGALPMINEGVLENPKVDAAFSCHLWGSIKEGNVHIKRGSLMASPDTFNFTIKGKGGHGGMPHLTIDPIVIGSQIIVMLQSIVSRRIDPLDSAVISIGSVHSGDAHNVIPETFMATGTVRSFNEEISKKISTDIENLIKGITSSYGAEYEFNYDSKFPPLINDSDMTELVGNAFEKIVGTDNVSLEAIPSMGGEDFAFFCKEVPSALAFVGIAKNENHPVLHHHPLFQWDDKNLLILSQGMAQIAIDYLDN